jgi:alpha-1,2-mannosyltransferase
VVLLFDPEVHGKDFRQEYLLARAVLDRANPYTPQRELAERYLPPAIAYTVPSLHPPFMAVLAIPFGLIPFQAAAALWLLFELLLLFVLAILATTPGGGFRPTWRATLAFSVLLVWYPVFEELLEGQLSMLLAVLLAGCVISLQRGCPALAGGLLGVAMAIKMFPAVLAGYILLRREWRVVLIAGTTALFLTGLSVVVVGPQGLASYLAGELPAGSRYLASETNSTLYGAILRFFGGGLLTRPLIDAPLLAAPLATLAALVVYAVTPLAVWRTKDAELGLAAGITSIVLAGPVAWWHYQILLVYPLFVVGRRLRDCGWPDRQSTALLVSVLIMGVPGSLYFGLLGLMRTPADALRVVADGSLQAGLATGLAGLPFLLQPLGPGLLLWVILSQLYSAAPATGMGVLGPCPPRNQFAGSPQGT